ncbi:MAG TPA: LuxR C-terminal-related transcriptional regulator, partial [Candidatus Baltobacteraceae bacterium]|nr:LuxR C-terminal-related transcriptional regulator [Candidatus Baltobacteraceae bacterium]
RSGMLTRALVCPSLVGRDDELAELVERRLAASRGHGSMVLVSGDAGIGKSRLLVAFRGTLSGGRASLGLGLNREFGNPPFGAVMEAMRMVLPSASIAQAQNRAEQLSALVEQFSQACARRCVVLLLEDLHWADDGTLLFLRALVPSIVSLRALVVATYRGDEFRGLEQLEPHLARLLRDRATYSIRLRPLGHVQTRRLIRLAAGAQHLQADVLEEIVERCDGNPFFAEELLKNALDAAAGAAREELPFTVRSTVLERVSGLDARSRALLTRAAVLGRRFDAALLAELCGLQYADALEVLRRLRSLQLVDELPVEPPAYAFRHALTQQAIYGELLSAERKPLHAQILLTLEDRDANVADLGYHAWAAGDPGKGVIYNEQAGDRSHALHVYGDAVRSYDRAIAVSHEAKIRAGLLVKSARSCAADGKAAQALDRYSAAAELYAESGSERDLTDLYLAMGAQARVAGDNERGMHILEHALAAMDSGGGNRPKLLVSLAYLHLDRGEVNRARELLAQSDRLHGTPEYQDAVQYADLVAGDVNAFRADIEINAVLHEPLGEFETLRARFNCGFGLAILGCDDEALSHFDALLPDLERTRLSSLQMLALANSALVHARGGRLSQARTCIERAGAIPEVASTGAIALAAAAFTVGFALWDEALVERYCSPEVVETAFASRINSTLGRIAGPHARWLWANGDAEGAHRILERAAASLSSPFGATETLLAAAEIGTEAARTAAFAHLDVLDGMSSAAIYRATAHHLRALRASHAGEPVAAQLHASDALAEYVRLGWPLHQAACLQIGGDVRRASVLYRRLHAAGPLRRTGTHAALDGQVGLSEREREIAALVARGTVNKHIAERLAVNQRTVEKHLTSIYEKLGLRNRSELAAYVTRSQAR